MGLNGKLLAGLAAVAALAAAVYYTTGTRQHYAEPEPRAAPAVAPAEPEVAPVADATTATAASETFAGEASGSLNFWKYARPDDLPGLRAPAGGEPILKIDLTPRSAVAVWNPEKGSLRVLTLAEPTSDEEAKAIVACILEKKRKNGPAKRPTISMHRAARWPS